MNSFFSITEALLLAKASEEWTNAYALKLFFSISVLFYAVARISMMLRNRSGKKATGRRSDAIADPGKVTALVAKLAHESLGIGPHQIGEPMEKLRIPRGDFLRFLDDLEEDHGLAVPESARSMSLSIQGVIDVLCQGR